MNRQKRGNTVFYDIVSEFLIPWIRCRRDARRDRLREEQLRAAERQRLEQLLAAEKLRREKLVRGLKLVSMGALIVILAVVLSWLWSERQRERKIAEGKMEQMREKELLDASFGYLGADRGFHPEVAMLTAIDSIARYRSNHQFVPRRAVLAIAFATAERRQHIVFKDLPSEEISAQIPCVESTDRAMQLVVKDAYTVGLRTSDGQIKDVPTGGKKITAIGFDTHAEKFAVCLADGEIITGEVSNPGQAKHLTGAALAGAALERVLGISDPAEAQRCIRTAPAQGWEKGYDDIIKDNLLAAITSLVTLEYPKDDVNLVGLEHTFTDEINKAFSKLESGSQKEAKRLLRKAFKKVNTQLDRETVKSVLATNLFVRATNQTDKKVQAQELRVVGKLNPNLQSAITALSTSDEKLAQVKDLMEKGNKLARDSRIDEAKAAYRDAIKLDSNLNRIVNPEEEWKKFAPWILTDAKEKMNEGYQAAAAGNCAKAIQLFKDTLALDPRQDRWLDPEKEARKTLAQQNASPCPTSVGGPELTPSGSPHM